MRVQGIITPSMVLAVILVIGTGSVCRKKVNGKISLSKTTSMVILIHTIITLTIILMRSISIMRITVCALIILNEIIRMFFLREGNEIVTGRRRERNSKWKGKE